MVTCKVYLEEDEGRLFGPFEQVMMLTEDWGIKNANEFEWINDTGEPLFILYVLLDTPIGTTRIDVGKTLVTAGQPLQIKQGNLQISNNLGGDLDHLRLLYLSGLIDAEEFQDRVDKLNDL